MKKSEIWFAMGVITMILALVETHDISTWLIMGGAICSFSVARDARDKEKGK